ncbi:MAG: SOS response-associated peptidase [Phycisphaeraceae bacterium]
MCGRFALNSTPRRIAAHFNLAANQFELFPRYNIAPTQPVVIIRQNEHSLKRELTHVVWGLIPSWAKDISIGSRMINARSESAQVKPGYRGAMKYRRCIVPADGFFEWQKKEGSRTKQPYFIHRADGDLVALAGLWEHWQGPGGEEIESCTILTCGPNEMMKPLHDRMPVILEPRDFERWMDTTLQDVDAVTDLMKPCDGKVLATYPVSTYVGNARNEGEKCIERVDLETGELFS